MATPWLDQTLGVAQRAQHVPVRDALAALLHQDCNAVDETLRVPVDQQPSKIAPSQGFQFKPHRQPPSTYMNISPSNRLTTLTTAVAWRPIDPLRSHAHAQANSGAHSCAGRLFGGLFWGHRARPVASRCRRTQLTVAASVGRIAAMGLPESPPPRPRESFRPIRASGATAGSEHSCKVSAR